MVKVVEEVKVLAEGRVEPEPCSVASSVLLCIVLLSLSGSFIGAQTNFSSGPVFVISTTFIKFVYLGKKKALNEFRAFKLKY